MVGVAGDAEFGLHEVHRFPNVPVNLCGTLHWDILRLYSEVLDGLRIAAKYGPASVAIDSWGVDYGLIGADGALIGNPVHYRDRRTADIVPQVNQSIGAWEMYKATGVQQLPINTIYQLAAAAGTPALAAARTLLLVPDLLSYWLTGEIGAEVTNASTTQLYDLRTGSWATWLMRRLGIAPDLFPALRQPGAFIGDFLPDVAARIGLSAPAQVVAVGSHDTASAVVAVPAGSASFAYISCGTWSLVGVELDQPVLTQASQKANFTNETGIDGTIRYLRNVMGLWLLQESIRGWSADGQPTGLGTLLAEAARVPPLRAVIDPDDPQFLPPGDMPARIAETCRKTGQSAPQGQAEVVRCILDSLALAYRRAIREVQELSGRGVDVVHIVGGGARNALLCQLTADACGLTVVAGPVEAAALGNILVQARSMGAVPTELAGLRELVRTTQPLRHYQPSGQEHHWEAAERRLPRSVIPSRLSSSLT